ncbi:MAG TPA: RluA family pseudouridine synthase [Coleofasciculaceae cyanobacterium]
MWQDADARHRPSNLLICSGSAVEGEGLLNQGWTYQEQVDRSSAGLTVLAYYSRRYSHSSLAEWQSRIAAGQILLDDHPTTADALLRAGQRLTYHRLPWQEPAVPLSFDVLYEDPDLLIVAKPSGLPVLPGGGFLEHTLLRQVQRMYPQEESLDSQNFPVPIHRLGRGTSGLMLMARSPLAKSHLSQQMRDRQIQKTYRALVIGISIPDQLTLTYAIGKIPHPILGYIYGATPDGRFAHSECRVLRRNSSSTLLEVTILTGRPHQIRIHLAAAGHPLLGDPLYGVGGIPIYQPEAGETAVPGDCGYCLHAYQLSFAHPRTGQPMCIVCPAPVELQSMELQSI